MSSLALTFNNSPISTINHNSQIWLTSVELAKALDYAHENAVTKIYNRYKDEFTDSMSTILPSTQIGSHGDSSGVQRIFSLRGCHLLAMLSRTKIAKEFRKWVLDILDNQLSSNPLQLESSTITKVQEGVLFNKVKDIAGGSGKIRAELWSRFQKHYSLSSYKNFPADKYEDAIQYLEAKQKEYLGNVEMFYISSKEIEDRVKTLVGELVEKPKQDALTINLKFPDGMRTMTMQFETSEFQHGRWLVSLMDGNLSIQAMPNDVLCLTTDKWIDYMTQERGYVVGKKLN